MKIAYSVIAIIVVLAIAGLIWHGVSKTTNPSMESATTTMSMDASATSSDESTQQSPAMAPGEMNGDTDASPASAAQPAPQSFTVNGNDATADLKTITVPAGTPVTITFGADAGTTYHGGLDFRSDVLNTGTIAPGSTKTITFTATKSFSFTPYWPSTNIAKPYTIDIVVQ